MRMQIAAHKNSWVTHTNLRMQIQPLLVQIGKVDFLCQLESKEPITLARIKCELVAIKRGLRSPNFKSQIDYVTPIVIVRTKKCKVCQQSDWSLIDTCKCSVRLQSNKDKPQDDIEIALGTLRLSSERSSHVFTGLPLSQLEQGDRWLSEVQVHVFR
jgi:hypothetical protein